jgi:hypothetical protein
MQTGDVAVHSVFDGVIPLPPGLLYPEVPVSVWQGVSGALDGEGMRCTSGKRPWAIPTQPDEEQ